MPPKNAPLRTTSNATFWFFSEAWASKTMLAKQSFVYKRPLASTNLQVQGQLRNLQHAQGCDPHIPHQGAWRGPGLEVRAWEQASHHMQTVQFQWPCSTASLFWRSMFNRRGISTTSGCTMMATSPPSSSWTSPGPATGVTRSSTWTWQRVLCPPT